MTVAHIELSGFTMPGQYSKGSTWDLMKGGEDEGKFGSVWSVPLPAGESIYGAVTGGLCGR